MRTKNHILILLENGMTINTIGTLTDNQIKVLSEKFSKKKENKEQWTKNVSQETTYTAPVASAGKGLAVPPPADPKKRTLVSIEGGNIKVTQAESLEMMEDETINVVNDPDATEDGMGMFESDLNEKFESKAQQGLFWAKCKNSTGKTKKKWCDMANEFSKSTSKKQYKTMPEKKYPKKTVKRTKKKTNENLERFLEDRIVNMLDEYINPVITKGDLLNSINERVKKSESVFLKNPKKMSMFSEESGIEMKTMKRPIGKNFSLGEDTKEKERTKTKPGTKERKRENPFKDPNPGVKEKPKANTKEKERTKEREKTKTPTRKNPFKDPNPGVKEKPKADIDKMKDDFISALNLALK
jgi:hypothetical protein